MGQHEQAAPSSTPTTGNNVKPETEPVNTQQNINEVLACAVYEQLMGRTELERRIAELETQINNLREDNARLEEACLDANRLAAERTKDLNVEREDHAKDMANFNEQRKAIREHYKEKQSLEMQIMRLKKAVEFRPQRPVGRILLEFWMLSPETKTFQMHRAYETTTTRITTWDDLPVTCRKWLPLGGIGKTYSWKLMVEDVARLDHFDFIYPEQFLTWLECVKVSIIGKRRCRCLYYAKDVEGNIKEAARKIPK